jgi:hypothetical protein
VGDRHANRIDHPLQLKTRHDDDSLVHSLRALMALFLQAQRRVVDAERLGPEVLGHDEDFDRDENGRYAPDSNYSPSNTDGVCWKGLRIVSSSIC